MCPTHPLDRIRGPPIPFGSERLGRVRFGAPSDRGGAPRTRTSTWKGSGCPPTTGSAERASPRTPRSWTSRPSTNVRSREVARGGAAEADAAVAAAREACPVWGAMAAKERAEVLHRRRRRGRGPRRRARRGRDRRQRLAPPVDAELRHAARRAQLPVLRRPPADADRRAKDYEGFAERVAWDPAGVTVVITPWNAPLMLATWRVAPALAAGNAVVLKPPEWAPLTASMLADIAREAGLPDGAFNVVQGIGEEAGAALVAHPGVDRIAFTGSVPDGQARRGRRRRRTSRRSRSSSVGSRPSSPSPTPTSTRSSRRP